MGKYYGACRSNYFRVKSVEALRTCLSNAPYEVVESADAPGSVCLLARGFDGGGGYLRLKHIVWDDEPGAVEREIYIPALVAEHLVEGEVAVFMQTGAEQPMTYLIGYSVAVHSDGSLVRVDLNEVYERAAAEFGVPRWQIGPVGT